MKRLFNLQQVSTDRLRTTALIKGNIETHQKGLFEAKWPAPAEAGPQVCLPGSWQIAAVHRALGSSSPRELELQNLRKFTLVGIPPPFTSPRYLLPGNQRRR